MPCILSCLKAATEADANATNGWLVLQQKQKNLVTKSPAKELQTNILEPLHPRMAGLISEAREKSPFYRNLYAELTLTLTTTLSDIPIVDHSEYWKAYRQDERNVTTGLQSDGIIMKTGGTTSEPKFVLYTQSELLRTTNLLARGLLAAGVRAGDRVGNLFYAGDLYGSFLLHILSLIQLPMPAVQIPIGGLLPPEQTAQLLSVCRVTAILSTVTSLVRLAEYCKPSGKTFPDVTVIMFAGEPCFPDQQCVIESLFPKSRVQSCIYGSMDAGVLATSAGTNDCREHQVLSEANILEIVNEDGRPVGSGRGRLVASNMIRDLMPVIRYPTGDTAEWVDQRSGVFRLLGRSHAAVRLGPVSLDASHVRVITQHALGQALEGFQLAVTRSDGKDALQIRLTVPGVESEDRAAAQVLALLYQERPMLREHVDLGLIAPVRVWFCGMSAMYVSPHSGKLPEIYDIRQDSPLFLPALG